MFKKIVVGLAIGCLASTSFARTVTVTFADNTTHEYENAPDTVTEAQVRQRVSRDFPARDLKDISGTVDDIDWKNVGMTVLGVTMIVVAVAMGVKAIQSAGKTHPCVNPSDRASDGSLCGARASSVRPGGA